MNRFALTAVLALSSFGLSAQRADHLGPMQGFPREQRGFSYQGMDIAGKYMLSCQDRGGATVYKLSGKDFRKVGQFKLASFNEVNHANVVTFGVEKYDPKDPLPLAYVSQCHKKPYEGRKDLLFVERIAPDLQSSTLVQTIYYDDTVRDFGYALQWVIDRKGKFLYGYGNTINNSDPQNCHRIIKFRLPALAEGDFVTLRREDALEDYLIEEVSGFRFNPIGQGLYIFRDKLYMPTGVGTSKHPSILYVWDLKKKSMETMDLSNCTTGELEDISRFRGHFWLQGQDGIFRLR